MKTRDYEKYREWEVQGVSIEGLIFCNFDEMKTHGQKLKNKRVQNKGTNGEEGGDQTFKIVREHPSGSNIFEFKLNSSLVSELRKVIKFLLS